MSDSDIRKVPVFEIDQRMSSTDVRKIPMLKDRLADVWRGCPKYPCVMALSFADVRTDIRLITDLFLNYMEQFSNNPPLIQK